MALISADRLALIAGLAVSLLALLAGAEPAYACPALLPARRQRLWKEPMRCLPEK